MRKLLRDQPKVRDPKIRSCVSRTRPLERSTSISLLSVQDTVTCYYSFETGDSKEHLKHFLGFTVVTLSTLRYSKERPTLVLLPAANTVK